MDGMKAAIYVRELPLYPPHEVLGVYLEDKWAKFDDLLQRCKGAVQILIVAGPEILGDNYVELLVNLSKVAEADLLLGIAGKAKTIRKVEGDETLPPQADRPNLGAPQRLNKEETRD